MTDKELWEDFWNKHPNVKHWLDDQSLPKYKAREEAGGILELLEFLYWFNAYNRGENFLITKLRK